MLLQDHEGNPLAFGAAGYNTLPTYDLSEQMVIQVEIGDGKMTEAAIDTTSPYLTITREMAKQVGVHLDMPEKRGKARIQGTQLYGKMYPVDLTLLADFGVSVKRSVLTFVPDSQSFDPKPLPPTIVGLSFCLERFFFAFDGAERLVYFG